MDSSPQPQKPGVSVADIEAATRSALGPNAIVESFESSTIGAGVGFLGSHFLLTVHARAAAGQPVVDIEMFAKKEPVDNDMCRSLLSFQMESAYFQKLLPALRSAVELPDGKEAPDWCPKCFLSREDLIIAENLVAKGYQTVGNWTDQHLTMDHYRQVCRVLARFHAAGLLLAQKRGRKAAAEICPEITTDVFASNDFKLGGMRVRSSGADTLAVIIAFLFPDASAERLKEMQDKIFGISRNLWDHLEEARIGPLVPCHGDCHPDNYFFKFDEQGNPIDAMIVDFQICRFNVPAMDISFFLYVTSSQEFREKNAAEIFRHYYDCLKEETARHGQDLEKILTFQDLMAGAERIKKFVVFMAATYVGLLFAPKSDMIALMGDALEMKRFCLCARSAELIRWFKTVPLLRERLEQLIRILLQL